MKKYNKEKSQINKILFLILILIIAILYVKQKANLIQKGYTIEKLEKRIDKLQNINNCLKIEITTLQSPKRIEQIAKKLGLVYPKSEDIISLEFKVH